MIKLITCDIDGTLVKNYLEDLKPSLFELIKKFKEKGVLFVATSGRQLPNLKTIFSPIKDEISYISENGALISHQNNIIFKSVMEDKLAKKLANKILDTNNLEVLICSANTTYVMPKRKEFLDHIQNEVKNDITIIKSLKEIDTEILKVSAYDYTGIKLKEMKAFGKELENKFNHTVSGLCWYDFMNYNTHKGNAIKFLQEKLNISKYETAAFGDNFNDIEMLKDAEYSFVMEEAHKDVKKFAKYECSCVETSLNELYNKFFYN